MGIAGRIVAGRKSERFFCNTSLFFRGAAACRISRTHFRRAADMANLYRNQRFIVDSDGHELNTSAQHHALEQTALPRWNNDLERQKPRICCGRRCADSFLIFLVACHYTRDCFPLDYSSVCDNSPQECGWNLQRCKNSTAQNVHAHPSRFKLIPFLCWI
jgi:hypothetical protein